MDDSEEIFKVIIKECFWGDYSYTLDDIRNNLNSGDEKFRSFLFSKILYNSKYPSKYLRLLFSDIEIKLYLSKIPLQNINYFNLRKKLIMANILGENVEISELSWKIK